MSGYVGEEPIDAQEWLRTGDLGYFVDGGLVVCGRAKELITVAGRNVFPTEVERVAAQVKGVREGAECGVVPADVVFVKPGSLPRTSSGKLRRLEVKRNLEVANR